MDKKIKLAINWAGACGGCDVSILDTEENILKIAELADIVYWPVAMDFKRETLKGYADKSIDVCLFNGMIRTAEQEEDAYILRQKSKILVSFGSCACFGGIPGLANFTNKNGIFKTAYQTTVTTVNADITVPLTETRTDIGRIMLPEFYDHVRALHQVVEVDYFIPGCPPPTHLILKAVDVIASFAEGKSIPPQGSFIASEKSLCSECERQSTKKSDKIEQIVRPHEKVIDPDLCMLEQGILCMGPFTRGGCNATCIKANMPCRGCFGPTEAQLDQGTQALSSFGSIIGCQNEDFKQRPDMLKPVKKILDPLGAFFRFTLPISIINKNCQYKSK